MTQQQVSQYLNYLSRSDGIYLPYFDLNGAPLQEGASFTTNQPNQQHQGYGRIRLLHPPKGSGKYRQRQGTLPHAYFPPAAIAPPERPYAWTSIAADPDTPILLTEGELKAARACMTPQFPPTIGLGGVDSFGGRRKGMPLLPELQNWEWKQRQVFICFDADNGTSGYKKEVQGAIDRLATLLSGLGAVPIVVHLGRAIVGTNLLQTETKLGLDDYILAGGDWPTLQLTQEIATVNDDLRYLEARYVMDRSCGAIIDLQSGRSYTVATLENIEAGRTVINAKGKPTPAVPVFLASPRRTDIEFLGAWLSHPSGLAHIPRYDTPARTPGDDVTSDTVLCYNNIEHPAGWFLHSPLTPEELGQQRLMVRTWLKLTSRFLKAEKGLFRLFHDWVAWPLQHLGQRNHTSWIFTSPETGIGKSLIAETVARMVGPLGIIVGPDAFTTQYNAFLEGKLFVVFNELSNEKGFHREFRAARTNDMLQLNQKYQPIRTGINYTNYIITTNEPIAYKVAGLERRDICYSPPQQVSDRAWMEWLPTIVPMLLSPANLRLLLLWYRFGYRIRPGYAPSNRAPRTEAFESIVEASMNPDEATAESIYRTLTALEPIPIIEHRQLKMGLDRSPYSYTKVLYHLRRLCGEKRSVTAIYKPPKEGMTQRILALRVKGKAFDRVTPVDRDRIIQVCGQALIEWFQAEGLL